MLAATTALAIQDLAAAEPYDPRADPAAIVVEGKARFTVLTPSLIRMEWSPDGVFEDRASLAFVNRRLPVPKFEVTRNESGAIVIDTGTIHLKYKEDGKSFHHNNLSIVLKHLQKGALLWLPIACPPKNLGGTTRTLDGVSGATALEDGLLTRDGWTLIDDSNRVLLDEKGWPTPRRHLIGAPQPAPPAPGTEPPDPATNTKPLDQYFFLYHDDYLKALRDFTAVAGRIPLPPRYMFGAWWSRYWAYSDAELRQLVEDFDAHDVPLDILVVDMDWHLDGWTGYTWNPQYFPDPAGFLRWCRQHGLRVTLNLHPADGVGKHESQFVDFCKALGLDPAGAERVPFNCIDPRFMNAYFELLHHPYEKMGVDFWWIDWQQGRDSGLPGLDPLFWLNHLHYKDMADRAAQSGRRPVIFSRWGGLGNHRYQIGFSGDTFCDWRSLAFQPYFTSTAGNVGYAYWSHDIGGHQPGPVDPELYARWIQWGALSPALRTHTTKNPDAERRIWKFPQPVFDAARKAFHLRYELIPYLYTAARRCYDESIPLCRPLYYHWPKEEEAYRRGGQYLLGDDLLVAPVARPADALSGCASVEVWLPPGDWVNWFTGRTYRGPTTAWLLVPLDEIPLFVRAGAVIPAQPKMKRSDERPLDTLVLHVWPGADGEASLYEDDGVSDGYRAADFAMTRIRNTSRGGERTIYVPRREGGYAGAVDSRGYELILHDIAPPQSVRVDGAELLQTSPPGPGWHYDGRQLAAVVRVPPRPVTEPLEVRIALAEPSDLDGWLAAGLRGQWARIDQAASLNPGDLPAILIDARADRSAMQDRFAVLRDARRVVDSWEEVTSALRKGPGGGATMPAAAEQNRLRGALHLLGVAVDVAVVEAGQGSECAVSIVSTHALPAERRVRGHISLHADGETAPLLDRPFDGLMPDTPHREVVALPDLSGQRTIRLRGAVSVDSGGAPIEIPIDRVLFPSINAWWIAGPFDAPFEKGLATVFPPEQAIDLNATYAGKDGDAVKWTQAVRAREPGDDLTSEFFVHLHEFFGKRHYDAVAYGLTYLNAPTDMDATLAIGSDDGVAVWLNGQEVHRKALGRAYLPRADRVPVRLRAGRNTLLLKVNQGGGDWGFSVFVESADGQPLTQVTAALDAEETPR